MSAAVFVVLGTASVGGHIVSACSLASVLCRVLDDVLVIVPAEQQCRVAAMARGVKVAGFESARWPSVEVVRIIRRSISFGAGGLTVFTFDNNSHYWGILAAVRLRCGCVSVIPGGAVHRAVAITSPTIVFSDELARAIPRFHQASVIVESRRFLPLNLASPVLPMASRKVTVGAVCRISADKELALRNYVEGAIGCLKSGYNCGFVLAGVVASDRLLADLLAIVEDSGIEQGAFTIRPDLGLQAQAFMASCDVIVGIGRTVMEAVSLGRPFVVLGPEGCCVSVPTTVNLARLRGSNFTGRGLGDQSSLGEELSRIMGLPHEQLLSDVRVAREWMLENLSAERAVPTYISVVKAAQKTVPSLSVKCVAVIRILLRNASIVIQRLVEQRGCK